MFTASALPPVPPQSANAVPAGFTQRTDRELVGVPLPDTCTWSTVSTWLMLGDHSLNAWGGLVTYRAPK